MSPIEISQRLSHDLQGLRFSAPITHVYNPLDYAWDCHEDYLRKYAINRPRNVLLLGMNPGPWGMAQSGVPFGDVQMLRDWLKVSGDIRQPSVPHPKRPIQGLGCARSEVSGTRLWGWARDRFNTPEQFLSRFYVHNYCPLCFMEASGRNFTPDKLPTAEAAPLFAACDTALRELILYLQPQFLVGVGAFAEARLRIAAPPSCAATIGRILHPSPASPAANRGWAEAVEKQLLALGVDLG